MTPTTEQQSVISFQGPLLVVRAYAGTGKTTTLVQYALENPQDRILYIAFNRAVRDEAVAKFPNNVVCKTSHQLAYAAIGKDYRHKLAPNIRIRLVMERLDCVDWIAARAVVDTLAAFMASADSEMSQKHLRAPSKVKGPQRGAILIEAQRAWTMMIDKEHDFPATHDCYLKLYQLSNPKLDRNFQTLLFDEAQDCNPVTGMVVLSQRCKIILVGDTHQQIYRFRGAVNAMDVRALNNAEQLYLTHSFRFGPRVAMVANAILEMKGETRPVIGRGEHDEVSTKPPGPGAHKAVLCRTVAGVIGAALEEVTLGSDRKVYWVGGIEGYNLQDLVDLYWFSHKQTDKIANRRLLTEFRHFDEYKGVAEESSDPEMTRSLKLLKSYNNLPTLLDKLVRQATKDESKATLTVSTAHRSKGLEWDAVILLDDYPDIFDPAMKPEQQEDELNLLYVASTRAMRHLTVNWTVRDIIEEITSRRERAG